MRSRTRAGIEWSAWLAADGIIRCSCEAGQRGTPCWHRGAIWAADAELRRWDLERERAERAERDFDPFADETEEEGPVMALAGAVANEGDADPDPRTNEGQGCPCGRGGVAEHLKVSRAEVPARGDRPGRAAEDVYHCGDCVEDDDRRRRARWDRDLPADLPFDHDRARDVEIDPDDPADDALPAQGEGRRRFAIRPPIGAGIRCEPPIRLASVIWSDRMAILEEFWGAGRAA